MLDLLSQHENLYEITFSLCIPFCPARNRITKRQLGVETGLSLYHSQVYFKMIQLVSLPPFHFMI